MKGGGREQDKGEKEWAGAGKNKGNEQREMGEDKAEEEGRRKEQKRGGRLH